MREDFDGQFNRQKPRHNPLLKLDILRMNFLDKEIERHPNREIVNHIKIPEVFPEKKWRIAEAPAVPQQRPHHIELIYGDLKGLSWFLTTELQHTPEGTLKYLLTAGLAVEVITGFARKHHDMDLVVMDSNNPWYRKYRADYVTPQQYWANMRWDPEALAATAYTAEFVYDGTKHQVKTVHPAIILVQKLSNAWGRPPRTKDIDDAHALYTFGQSTNQDNDDNEWVQLINQSIHALPHTERELTTTRVKTLINQSKS